MAEKFIFYDFIGHVSKTSGASASGGSRLTSKMRPISASNKCVYMPKMRLVASASVTLGHA